MPLHSESNSMSTGMLQVLLTEQSAPDPSIRVGSEPAGSSSSDIVPQSTNDSTSETPIQAQEGKVTPTMATMATESTSRDAVSESANGPLSMTSTAAQEAKETPARATQRIGSTKPSTSTPSPEEAPVRTTRRMSRPATAIHPPTQPPSTGSRKKKPR